MEQLGQLELDKALGEFVKLERPFLGICLGLQALFDLSEESDGVQGLGLVSGTVKRFQPQDFPSSEAYKVPHMGWNELQLGSSPDPLFKGIKDQSHFYFVHSYYVEPTDKTVVAGTSDYGKPFCAAIRQDNIFACQFHPEKSQENGLRVIRNFTKA